VNDHDVAPELSAFLTHLRRQGVALRVADPHFRDPDEPGHPHGEPVAHRELRLPGLPLIGESRRGRIGSDHATWSVAADLQRHALVRPGDTAWEIGAGTAVLGVVAHHLGATRLVATDVDRDALEVARGNLAAAGVEAELHAGSLLDAVPADAPEPAVVIANLPHKPRRESGTLPLAEDGGPEGDELLLAFCEQVAARTPPGTRLVFFQHSLPHPRNLVRFAEKFDLTLLSWKRRLLAPDEYGELQGWFVERAAAGTSYLATDTGGRRFLVACVWLATRR
jgi:hypothetical protein